MQELAFTYSFGKTLLLSFRLPSHTESEVDDSLNELHSLATTMGCEVLEKKIQVRSQIEPGTFFGKGKLQEWKDLVEALDIEIVLVDASLTPKQAQNIEKILKRPTLDRTQVILEIFAHHAKTRESKMQIALAQAQYLLPRLVGMWKHLDRERGGIGHLRGAGEKQIESDRQLLRDRIALLKQDLKKIEGERKNQKKRRHHCLKVSLVGYTNAGKSTVMNALTHCGVLVENKLFATLESTTRLLDENSRPQILLSDTVGFIKNIPHELVASFRSTLEILRDADLLLHVVDASADYAKHIQTTLQVIEDIQADCVPILLVFNKVDQLNLSQRMIIEKHYPDAILVSAIHHEVETLQESILAFFEKKMETLEVHLSYEHSENLAQIYAWSRVNQIDYKEDGIHLNVTALPSQISRLRHHLDSDCFKGNPL